jgi:riboflavin transporter FmnP
MKSKNLIKFISRIAVFSAIAGVLDIFVKFPLPIFPSFLKMKFPDVIGLLSGFMFGPISGCLVQFIRVVINILYSGTETSYIGELFDLLSGIAIVLPASLIYKHKRDVFGALWGVLAGVLLTILVACVSNYFVMLPLYGKIYGYDNLIKMCSAVIPSINSIWDIVLSAILPFNFIKYTIVGIVTFLAYKQLHRFIKFVENKIYQEENLDNADENSEL